MSIEWTRPESELPDVAIGESLAVLIKTKTKGNSNIRESIFHGGDITTCEGRGFIEDRGFDYGTLTSLVDVSSAMYSEHVVGWCYI